jgi:hypothetical protein
MKTILAALLGTMALVTSPSPAAASTINFHVALNTSPLVGNASGPFALDFALIDGSGSLAVPNTVTASNFTFAGGGPTGSPMLTGGATGSLAGGVTLSDGAAFLNEFFQTFTAGSAIGFDVLMTGNVDPGPTPDAFSFAILDRNLQNLPTTGLGDSLVLVNISRTSLSLSDVQTFSTTSPAGITATASPIPEPASLVFLASGLLSVRLRRSRKG